MKKIFLAGLATSLLILGLLGLANAASISNFEAVYDSNLEQLNPKQA